MYWPGFLSTIAGLSVALMLIVPAIADEVEQTTAQDGHVDRSPTEPPARTHSRSVYKVDDVGMIIGGASEDAKAKVGRLPIRD
jgi:hypothetical protein